MGNKQSSQSVKNSLTDIINKNTLNSFTRNLNEQSSNCNTNQYAEIETLPGSVVNCSIDITQKASLDCKSQAYFASQNENILKNDIKNSLDQSFKSDQKQENPSFTLVPYSEQSNQDRVNIQNYIRNIVDRNLTTENLNKCLMISTGIQQGKLKIGGTVNCPPDKNSISVNQELALQLYAQCGSNIINKTLSDDKFVSDLVTKAESSQSNLTSGFGAIFIMIIVLIIFLVVAYIMFKSSGSSSTSQSSNTTTPSLQIITK